MEIDLLYDSGYKLEIFTNSCYQTMDYYIDTNLKVIENNAAKTGKIDVLEIDIFAKKFSRNHVKTTLVECKRGCNFNDIFKFSGVSQLIGADENIIVALTKQLDDIKVQAKKLNIVVLDPNELFEILSPNDYLIFSMFYSWNEIKNSVMSKEYMKTMLTFGNRLSRDQEEAYSTVREYLSIINGKIWREPDLISRAVSFKDILRDNKDFVRKVAKIQKLKPANENSQFYIELNEICQAAGSLIIDVKLAYIICAVECALAQINTSVVEEPGFHNLVSKLSENIELAVLVPKFLQYFVNIFGGIYFGNQEDINNICGVIGISNAQFNGIIKLLKDLFILPDIDIQWGFEEDFLVTCLKYTPALFKGIGIENREKFGFETNMFVNKDNWNLKLKSWRKANETN